jgi:hypothetical protein
MQSVYVCRQKFILIYFIFLRCLYISAFLTGALNVFNVFHGDSRSTVCHIYSSTHSTTCSQGFGIGMDQATVACTIFLVPRSSCSHGIISNFESAFSTKMMIVFNHRIKSNICLFVCFLYRFHYVALNLKSFCLSFPRTGIMHGPPCLAKGKYLKIYLNLVQVLLKFRVLEYNN